MKEVLGIVPFILYQEFFQRNEVKCLLYSKAAIHLYVHNFGLLPHALCTLSLSYRSFILTRSWKAIRFIQLF